MLGKNAARSLVNLPIGSVVPNPNQPRKFFDPVSLDELAKSVAEVGVIQPIIVRPDGECYEIIAGERRWRASKIAELEEMPCIILETDESSRKIISLVENIHRSDLSPIEEAQSMKELLDNSSWNQTELGAYLGRSQSFIANKLRLLKLDQSVQKMLLEKKLSERQARFLLTLPDETQAHVALKMISEGLKGEDLKRFYIAPEPETETAPPPEIEPEPEKHHEDPAAIFFERLETWADENIARGVPVSWTIKEITQSELVAEIRVDLKGSLSNERSS